MLLAPRSRRVSSNCNGERKQFFFEKKNQKLLLCWMTRPRPTALTEKNKSFLVLFFKKELLLLRLERR
jgi:hypothetical protein